MCRPTFDTSGNLQRSVIGRRPRHELESRHIFGIRPQLSRPESPITNHSNWHILAAKANNVGLYHQEHGRMEKAVKCFQIALRTLSSVPSFDNNRRVFDDFLMAESDSVGILVPENPCHPIVLRYESPLIGDKKILTAAIMCNIASLYNKMNSQEKANSFYLLAEHTLKNHDRSLPVVRNVAGKLIEYIQCSLQKQILDNQS